MSTQVKYVSIDAEKCEEIIRCLLLLLGRDEHVSLEVFRLIDDMNSKIYKSVRVKVADINCHNDTIQSEATVREGESWLDAMIETLSRCEAAKVSRKTPGDAWPPAWIGGGGNMYEMTGTT